jgi:mannose-6-phosphate isomerase
MSSVPLYPLRFEPIYEYRPWGGRRLADRLGAPLPGDGPIGEAWVLSDRDDHPSLVANGPLEGQTIRQLLADRPRQLMGRLDGRFTRFPLLLKFLDVLEKLSVQVHPSDEQTGHLPAGETGKTEAWVVLAAEGQSRVYAGLKQGDTPDILRRAVAGGWLPAELASFVPRPGDAVLVTAGTVHALVDVVVFEVQENSDVTFRLYDWDRVDPKTGRRRTLHIDEAMACIDFGRGPVGPVVPERQGTGPGRRERLFSCPQFCGWRVSSDVPITVGADGVPRIVVCLDGAGDLAYADAAFRVRSGDVWLLPAEVGASRFDPHGTATVLEVGIPEAQR